MTDIIIIGAGPGGLTGAIYAARAGFSVLVFESIGCGGQAALTAEIENYPGIKYIKGWEFAMQLSEQAKELNVPIISKNVIGIEDNNGSYSVKTADDKYECKCVIIANGAKRRKLGCDGEEKLTGAGVSYCATCDGAFFKEKTTVVIGGGNTALEDAEYLSNICKKVYIVHRRNEFRGEKRLIDAVMSRDNIEIIYSCIPVKINGDKKVSSVTLKNRESNEEFDIQTDAVFVAIGLQPDNSSFSDIVSVDEKGYIIAGENCKTSKDGIFACGDTRTKDVRQIVTACADGAVAVHFASLYINNLRDK